MTILFLFLIHWFLSTLTDSQRLFSENLSQSLSRLVFFLVILLKRKQLLSIFIFIILYVFALIILISPIGLITWNFLLFFEGKIILSLIKPWTNLKFPNALFDSLSLVSILSFCLYILRSLSKPLNLFHNLASKFCLNLLTKYLSKDSILTENWHGVCFIPCSCNLGYIGQKKKPLKARRTSS